MLSIILRSIGFACLLVAFGCSGSKVNKPTVDPIEEFLTSSRRDDLQCGIQFIEKAGGPDGLHTGSVKDLQDVASESLKWYRRQTHKEGLISQFNEYRLARSPFYSD